MTNTFTYDELQAIHALVFPRSENSEEWSRITDKLLDRMYHMRLGEIDDNLEPARSHGCAVDECVDDHDIDGYCTRMRI